jgi:copper homeostasis protein
MLLEICANSFQSAKNAQEAGAHRIELCQALSLGGITPSYGLLKKVKKELSIETYVLIRPRSGDFCYSDSEFEVMKRDIQICKELGFKGIVSGVLKTDRTLDVGRTKELVELAKPLLFTFHRAFDEVQNPELVLQQLIELGVERILTSGQKPKAMDGINLLKELHKQADNKITIMPGSGINAENAKQFKEAGFKEIHASATKPIETNLESTLFGDIQLESNMEEMKSILKVIS